MSFSSTFLYLLPTIYISPACIGPEIPRFFIRLSKIRFLPQMHYEHLITVYHPQVDLKSGQICMTRPSPLVYPEVPLDQHGRVSLTTQLFTVGVRSAKVQLVAAMVGLKVSHIVLGVMFLVSGRIVSAQEPRFLVSSGSAVTVNSSVITWVSAIVGSIILGSLLYIAYASVADSGLKASGGGYGGHHYRYKRDTTSAQCEFCSKCSFCIVL